MNCAKLILIVLFCALSSAAFSQTRPRPKATPTRAAAPVEKPTANYKLKLKVYAGGEVALAIISDESTPLLNPSDLSRLISDLPTGENKWNPRSKNFPAVIVEAEQAAEMLDVFNPISLFRGDRTDIRIEIPNGPTLQVPLEPKEDALLFPDPLFLAVKVEQDRSITLNNEEMGTLDDLSDLIAMLRRVFTERSENGVLRRGTNRTETSVTIRIALNSIKFSDLTALAIAVAEAGSDKIFVTPNFGDEDEPRKAIFK